MIVPVQIVIDVPETQGPTGPEGPPGPQGPQGLPGVPGVGDASSVSIVAEWTPVIGGSGGESGQSYSSQKGYYIKTGRLVHCWCYTQFSAKGNIIGALLLKGLPFPTANVPMYFAGTCSYSSNLSPDMANSPMLTLHATGASSAVFLFAPVPGSNPKQLVSSDINDHTQLIFSLAYLTD